VLREVPPRVSSCGGIFRDHMGTFLGAFSANIGVATSLYAEICAAIYAIEFASGRGWTRLIFGLNATLSYLSKPSRISN
jgi:ribonuclease HI